MGKKAKQTDKIPGAARRAGLSEKQYRKLAGKCCNPDDPSCDDCPLKKAMRKARKKRSG